MNRLYGIFDEKSEKNLNYTISDLIVLLVYVYSLVGEECYYGIEEEHRIKKYIIDELESDAFRVDERFKLDREFINRRNSTSLFSNGSFSVCSYRGLFTLVGEYQNYSSLVDRFFQNLKYLKFFRKNLKQHK